MSRWRAVGIERIPELRRLIEAAESIMSLWIDLGSEFARAYECEPRNEALIAKIYAFADWCIEAPRSDAGHDPVTSVVVGFYEHIPTIRAARDDTPRWFSYEEIARNRMVFSYFIGDAEYDELVRYVKANRRSYVQRNRSA